MSSGAVGKCTSNVRFNEDAFNIHKRNYVRKGNLTKMLMLYIIELKLCTMMCTATQTPSSAELPLIKCDRLWEKGHIGADVRIEQ